MTDQELKRVIRQAAKEAVEGAEDRFKGFMDQAEERFGKRLDERLLETERRIMSDVSSEFFAAKRQLERIENSVEDVRQQAAKESDIALVEAFDRGHKAADIFKAVRRTTKDHEKRITALEQARG